MTRSAVFGRFSSALMKSSPRLSPGSCVQTRLRYPPRRRPAHLGLVGSTASECSVLAGVGVELDPLGPALPDLEELRESHRAARGRRGVEAGPRTIGGHPRDDLDGPLAALDEAAEP